MSEAIKVMRYEQEKKKHFSLEYVRPATVKNDGYDGHLYGYQWETGWETLIFPSHERAEAFAEKNNLKFIKPKL